MTAPCIYQCGRPGLGDAGVCDPCGRDAVERINSELRERRERVREAVPS